MAYVDEKASGKKRPKQLFVTKNPVLREEVEKSFWNMGQAYRKRANFDAQETIDDEDQDEHYRERNPLFLTSSEWLEILGKRLKSFYPCSAYIFDYQ